MSTERVLDEVGDAIANVEALAVDETGREAARECLRAVADIRRRALQHCGRDASGGGGCCGGSDATCDCSCSRCATEPGGDPHG